MAEILSDLGRTEKIVQIRSGERSRNRRQKNPESNGKTQEREQNQVTQKQADATTDIEEKVVAAAPNETGEKTDAEAIESEMGKSHE